MKTLISIIAFVIFYFINIFAVSNIILPITYALPKLIKAKKQSKLKNKIPLLRIFTAPITWLILLIVIYTIIKSYFESYVYIFNSALIISIISLLFFSNKKDMADDFQSTYKEYLKE